MCHVLKNIVSWFKIHQKYGSFAKKYFVLIIVMIGFCRLNKESLLMIGASSAQSVCGMHASILCWSCYSGSFISHNIPWCSQPQHRKCYKYCCPWWENQSILNEKRIKLLCSKFINPTNVVSQQLFFGQSDLFYFLIYTSITVTWA